MELEILSLKKDNRKKIVKEIRRGKSLARSFMNVSLLSESLSGKCLDLGSRSSAASYNRFLQKGDDVKITYTDFHQSSEDMVKMNLEDKFPMEASSYKTITCFNTLEHIYNHEQMLSEAYRVLEQGGQFIGGVPFLVNYHADPHDYFRYTHETLQKLGEKAGFKIKKIMYLGHGPITAGISLFSHILPKWMRVIAFVKAYWFDLAILKWKKSQRKRYPLGYMFVFEKE